MWAEYGISREVFPQRLRQHVSISDTSCLSYRMGEYFCLCFQHSFIYPISEQFHSSYLRTVSFILSPNIFISTYLRTFSISHLSNSSSQRIYLNRYVLPMFYKRVYLTASLICLYLLFINQGIPTVTITFVSSDTSYYRKIWDNPTVTYLLQPLYL